jgi:hypothetical protein
MPSDGPGVHMDGRFADDGIACRAFWAVNFKVSSAYFDPKSIDHWHRRAHANMPDIASESGDA